MRESVLYSRDLLYPTENLSEPGSIHVEVLKPSVKAKIPVIVECKTSHSPIKYLNSIVRIMQSDIFDRIFVDIVSAVSLYIKVDEEILSEFEGSRYVLVIFNDGKADYIGVDVVEN